MSILFTCFGLCLIYSNLEQKEKKASKDRNANRDIDRNVKKIYQHLIPSVGISQNESGNTIDDNRDKIDNKKRREGINNAPFGREASYNNQ